MDISKDLIQACMQQDEKAQKELYRLLHSPLLKICKRYFINREDALTVFHNGMLKIYSGIHKFRYNKSFYGWCKVLMVNTVIDEVRKNRRRLEVEKDYDLDLVQIPQSAVSFNHAEQKISWEQVERMLSIIPESSRLVFNLYVFEGYNHREIAELLKIPEGTSRWHLSNARKVVKTRMPKEIIKELLLA